MCIRDRIISDYDFNPHSTTIRYCRVVLNRDLATADLSSRDLTKRFNVYLNFTVTCSTNSLVYKRELTSRQEEIYELIKSMHDSGLGYRRIAKRLRDYFVELNHLNTFHYFLPTSVFDPILCKETSSEKNFFKKK